MRSLFCGYCWVRDYIAANEVASACIAVKTCEILKVSVQAVCKMVWIAIKRHLIACVNMFQHVKTDRAGERKICSDVRVQTRHTARKENRRVWNRREHRG